MDYRSPIELGNELYLIDGFDLGFQGRTGTYVCKGEAITLVETGPSPSVPRVKKGLEELSIPLEDVKYIVLTHIHLDHAGGAGLLAKDCPNATILVHERGKRHLADPTKLEAGARAVYGQHFDKLFHPIVPIPEERIKTVKDGETLTVGSDRTLTFMDTPGHAKHHIGIHDSLSNGIFTGDTAGIRYHQTEEHGVIFYLPTTSPNQFDPDAMLQSIDRFRRMKPDRLYFGHFGLCEEPDFAFDQVSVWIQMFVDAAEKKDGREALALELMERVRTFLSEQGIPGDHSVYELLKLDMDVCAMGLVDYMQKNK